MKKIKYSLLLVGVLVLATYFTHASPEAAIRLELFHKGYYRYSFGSEIIKSDTEGGVYYVSPAPYEEELHGQLDKYRVKKGMLMYTAEYDYDA